MNPFKYGKEVSGYQFYDRTESCDQLYHTLKDGSTNVVLLRRGVIDVIKGTYVMSDPFFARYVRER